MEKLSNKITIKILLIFSLPLLFFSITNVLAIESIEDYVFAPDSKPYNRTYGEWEAKFWELHVNLEPDKSPASPNYKPTECLLLKDENMTFLSDFYSYSYDILFHCKSQKEKSYFHLLIIDIQLACN